MEFLNMIFNAGIVGCGGAGFPTHVKLKTKVEYMIINAAECEPLLRTDRYLMKNRAEEIISAIVAAGEHVGAKKKIIALKETYIEEIKSLEVAIKKKKAKIEIRKMKNFYPAGDEQVMVYEVTNKVIPPAGLPSDVGCVVLNIATMNAIYDSMNYVPFTQKYLTVTGEVKKPVIVKCPIGTPIMACIDETGLSMDDYVVILGGPLMGQKLEKSEIKNRFVTKTTSGIIVLPKDSRLAARRSTSVETMLKLAKTSCIQCSFCTELCPRHMMGHPIEPHKIMRKLAFANNIDEVMEDYHVKQALLCSECGVCEEYACPMGLQPRRINKILKNIYAENKTRYQKTENEYNANEMREYRLVPSKRIANRMEIEKYYDYNIDELVEINPSKVSVPLSQHIGAPAKAVVSVKDYVKVGQLIGQCEEGNLGANIHASIDGRVVEVSDKIVIER